MTNFYNYCHHHFVKQNCALIITRSYVVITLCVGYVLKIIASMLYRLDDVMLLISKLLYFDK